MMDFLWYFWMTLCILIGGAIVIATAIFAIHFGMQHMWVWMAGCIIALVAEIAGVMVIEDRL